MPPKKICAYCARECLINDPSDVRLIRKAYRMKILGAVIGERLHATCRHTIQTKVKEVKHGRNVHS